MGKKYTDVLLEDMNHKFDVIMEAIQPLAQIQRDVVANKEDLQEVKSDVKVIKLAVTKTNQQVRDHERRITTLEAA